MRSHGHAGRTCISGGRRHVNEEGLSSLSIEKRTAPAMPRQSENSNLVHPAIKGPGSRTGRISSARILIQDCHLDCGSSCIIITAPLRASLLN
jgi:hypothetical protein